jgi:DNA cross-link repair 1A protein
MDGDSHNLKRKADSQDPVDYFDFLHAIETMQNHMNEMDLDEFMQPKFNEFGVAVSDAQEIVELPDSNEAQENICPVCSLEIKIDLNSHVNACLDNRIPCLDNRNHRNTKQSSILSFLAKSPSGKPENLVKHELLSKSEPSVCLASRAKSLPPQNPSHQPTPSPPNREKTPPSSSISPPNELAPPTEVPEKGSWSLSKKSGPCPHYKRVPNTNCIVVDAFCYGKIPNATSYFLTHYHADHYGGLTKKFDHGMIYASTITKSLVVKLIGVDESKITVVDVGQEVEFTLENGKVAKVTSIDANHCPGSVLFLFKIPNGNGWCSYLHTGDMRFCREMLSHPALLSLPRLDGLYLDTTYARPQYQFPDQKQVVDAVCELLVALNTRKNGKMQQAKAVVREVMRSQLEDVNAIVKKSKSPMSNLLGWVTREAVQHATVASTGNSFHESKTLVIVGSYQIGKERMYQKIAQSLKTLVYVEAHKRRVLSCLQDEALMSVLTSDIKQAGVHVVNMGKLNAEELTAYMKTVRAKGAPVNRIIAIRPTGWTWTSNKGMGNGSLSEIVQQEDGRQEIVKKFTVANLCPYDAKPDVTVIPAPYSEHSSYNELEEFVVGLSKNIGVTRCVPTVGSGGQNGWRDTQKILDDWVAMGSALKQ